MAERPLYTLYKNLKAQNYDVPNDYDKFESALTRDGKSGADNRHAIYENLKAQNFDVPDTYERFYSALFEPRSKTSSRAKGGSVPMSAADRARFSAGAAAISASAQQTMNNAGRYNRLKQRKQKQQKDFGRVNLGTHKTAFGGDANNVVKDDFAYNPETGKAGAYVTSDNDNAYTQNEAEQKQAILDEQNNSYQQAVDTGEIPSVLDVRDKNGNYDLQENIGKNGTYLTEEGAQRQFDKKLADAYARKKEIEALIAEDNRQHGNPLLSYGASIGAGNGRTAQQSDYRNKLATSLSLVTEQIGALEAVKQYPTSSWGEDALKALDNTVFTAKTWDFGLTDFATMGQMERIKTKMDNNIPLSGSDKILLKSKLGADAAAALEDEKMGNIYRWTKIAGQSLPFMADFFLTGGYGGITKGVGRGALKFAAKRGMGKVSAAILKNTGIVAGDVIGSYAMAGTEQAMKTGADIMQRHLGNLYQDEKGDYKFGTFDENGNLLHEGGESIGTALYKGLTSAMVENYTEKLFGHNYGIKKGAIAAMEKHGMAGTAQFFKNIGKSGWYTNSKKWMEKFGINGFGEEVMEEEIGIPLHALLDGDNNFSDLGDAKQQLDIIGGMAISVGSMYAMGAGSRPIKGIYNRAQYYRFRNKVNVADNDAQSLFGDNWADIKDKIDNATNEQMGGVLADILRQRDTMTKEQINAAVNYGVNLMKMRGYNIAKTAEMNAKEITNEPTTPEEQHQADIDNAYSEGHDADDADKHNIQLEQNDKANELAAMLHVTPEQLHDMADEDLEAMTGQNDKLDQAIYDYQVSTAKYQGVMDGAQDEVDMAAHQAAMETDNMTDLSRGTVRKATFKATGGLEDYEVYIISGNIATHDDGSIDVGNSDDMIIYYDPTTGRKEHADAMMFADLIEELPAADVKAQAINDAKENAIKKIAGIIDGTVEVGSQFSVTDADGTEHTYEVLADNGDGTAMITIDGNVPTELVKGENVQIPYSFADLQQMKDMEDQKRLEAAKAEREQIEKERAEQQTQETEETQPSFDFNQILNDDGNVVLVDVLDEDGNTKYPDSKLFLIRDTGAKAKVVELKSDGTIVPRAVNKEDVATISSMSLDEYKKAMPESSMIEDNSGENGGEKEVETPTIEGETAAPAEETAAPESAETPATEQTPAMTLEDGTEVPMLEDGNPDFSKLTAEQTAELYDSQFGEDADNVISGWVSDAKKALDKANNMTVKGKTFVEQKASKDAKEKAIADAQAAYNSAVAIRDAYNERQLSKVEDTAEGRKNLIEKARRKFARLKSSVKDDADAVAQIYKETVGSLLHRLYDGTGIDVTDTIPLTAEEYVASNLGAHSINYEGTETSKGVKQETGLSREDFAKTQLLAADGKGTTIDNLVHSLWENRPSNLDSLNTQDIRNALIGVLTSGFKASEARSYVENIRIAQAEKLIEEERTAAENATYYEQQKAKEEEEKKKAELEKKAEEENKKAKEEKTEDNEQTKFPDKLKEGSKAIEAPGDATDEKPFGEQLDEANLPFSAKENGKQQTTSERAADVEKNKVDDMKVVDNIVGQKTRKAFDRLAKMMGANIQWQYSDKLGNGWIQETKDADGNVHRTIFITLDSSITEGAQFIFGHEMTHQIKNLNPAAYNELTQLVLDTYGSDAFDKAVDETMQRYSDAGFSGRDREYYAEEVVADSVGEMIRDLNLAHTLAMKMSHPLLAAIHEILQKIKLAFFGTEYSDVTKNIIRSIEQAYVKTAKGEVTNSETGEDVSFSLRQKPEPKKKGIGYKVFVLKDGKLYPPMVANPDGAATPVGVWLDADAAPIAGESKTGRPQVKQGGKGTQGGSGKLAYRPGWHLGVVPYAIQFNRKDADGNKTLFPKNFVFAEVEYAADVDYQEEARQEGINPSGKYQHSLAGLKHLPTDGYYMYRTNPNPETDPWVITGAMKVNRILTRAEQAELVKNAGREPQQIQEGDIVTDDVVNSINQEIAAAPKFSIKTYHGSQSSFDHFDHSFMGSGEGAQAYGWGTYVTEVEGIAKAYAKQNAAKRNTEYSSAKFEYDTAKSSYNFAKGTYDFRMQDIDKLNNTLKWAKEQLVKAKESNRKNWIDEFEARVADTERALKENQDKLQDEKAEMGKAKKEMDEAKKRLDAIPEPERNLYTVEIPDDTGSNYIEWDGKAPDGLKEKVLDRLYNERREDFVDKMRKAGFNDDQIKEEADYTVNKEEMADTYLKHSATGGGLYRDLSYYLGEQKKASLFLKDMGIDGVKVIAKRNAGGNKEGKMNYVIFDENNAQITNHTKFSLRLKSAIDETETNPSDAQKESGNYKKGHIKFGGYDYTIENPKGSTRSGKDANGKEWKVTMHDTYGYIRGKFGKDGDHLDMFINDKADLDNWNGDVFVVDQVNPDGSFDEHKVMYGYDSMDDAKKAYLANYSDGWKGLGNITGASKDEFDKWLDTSNRKLKPFADYANVKFSLKDNQGNPLNQDGTLKLDKIKSVDELTDEDFLHPTRNVELPSLPNKIADAIGTEGKPVVIKKNIFERNYMRHKDVTPELSKTIFKSALYNTDLYGQNQKKTRPYNWVLINTKDEKGNNRTVLLEVNPNKDNVEIVHWHFVDERGLEKIKKQADREDGQLLILPSDKEEVGALSDPTVNLSAAKIDNSSETAKENGEKFSLKDDEYLKAVENGDMEKAQKMVNEAAEAAGYSTDSSYQGTSAFNGSAPWGNGYFLTKEERKEAWDNDEYDGDQTLGDYIHRGIDAMNLDFIALDPRNYRAADPMRKEAIDNVRNAIQKKSETITMYRSVPSDVKEGSFRNGDWVTPSRAYAVDNAKVHGWGDNFNIIEQKVPVDEIWWDGNDIAEWGYGREEDYVNDTDFAYKNTKNNRKLLDAVTYDDNDNVIPLSQRFNENNADVRYSLKDEKTMFGMHNISLDKLRKAIKQGGFAAPSMGVIDSKNGIYSGYGEITLIPKAEKIAKRTGKNIGTYAADAWTPIYPPVEKKFGGNGGDVAYDDIESVPKEMQSLTRNAINSFMDGRDTNSLAYLYLHEKGKAPELVHVEGKYPKELHDEVKGILGKLNGIYNTTDEQKEKLLDLFIREVYDGNKEEFDNDIKKFIKKDEEFIKKRPNSNISKDKQLDVGWMKEHGYDYGALSRFVDGILRDAETSGKVDENATMKAAQQYIQDNGMKEDFDSWKEKLNDRYNVEEVIFAGYKADGNRKYLPNTVENAVKVMKQDGKNASVGSASFSHFVASILKPMGTLDQIRKKKGNLTGNYEDVEKFQEKWQPVYDELADKMQPDAEPFESYGMDRLEDAATQKNPKKYAKDEYGVDLTDEDIDKLNELIDAVKNEKPSIYFETKFMRPYGLDEFEKAIVPNDTPSDVVDALKMAGIDVSSYERGNAEDRQKVTMDAINSSDNIRFSLKSMMEKPEGWKQANKKTIHIAEAIERDPKFSLKNLDGTLIKAGTYFSGGGLVEEGLKGIIDPVVAVEYDEKISGVYRNNFGQHIVTADVRDVDPKELVKQIDGEVEYFHASPVCKNYSQAKSNHAEVELDKETAASTAEFINAVKPKVVTIENVKGYKDSDAMKTITDALDANGYTWDADVYNAADYGGYTNRERLIVRAVRDGKLPAKPEKMARKSGWYEAVADIIPTLTEKKNGVAPWMDIRLKADGIDWRNIDKPLYVMGSAYADGKVPHAFADELLPTLRTKSGDVIVMPDGKVYRAMGRVLARVSGVSDDYKMPFSESLSHTIIGNGIPTQLTEHVIAPLLTGSDPKFSIRTYHGTGVNFDKFDLSHAFEGEGSETFGHGVYVTNSKKIGDNYAQRAKDRKGKFGFDYKIDMSAEAGEMLSHYINKNQDVDKGLENARQDLKSALEMFPDDETLKELSAILQKNNNEIAESSNEAYRYDVDIPDDNGENYLGWNDSQNFPLEKWYRLWEITHHGFSDNEYFKDGGARYDKDRIERIIQMKLESPENGMQKLPTLKGEELYHALEDFFDRERPLRGAKLASRALSEIGFVGIKYPAGLIHGGAKEGDYNYVIFDENNANIVGNTRFSLRYDKFEHDLNQWKKDNNLPNDAQRPTIPQRNAGESAVDFLRRVDEYRKQMALWKTAPTYEQHLLSDDTALGEFNRELQKGSVLKRIAFQDSMLAIRKAQEAIMKEVGVDRLNMAEDAYTAENRSHGKGKNEFEEYNNEFLQPLRKAYHQMKKVLGDSYDNVRIYMMAKHGLERDAQMAFKKSLEADFEDVAQRSAAYKAYKGDMNRIINDSDLEFGRVDFNTWRQRDNALRTKYSPSYMNYRYDKMGIAYDYSGLSALFDGSDFEEAAHKLIKDIESKYVTETHNLWDATNAATKKILRDGYKAGMMSKDTYQYVRDMYSHYIPLRGWDGTTADQVWDYIGGGKGAFNQTLKKANGRTSIADDPIAYIENMAESGILLNNKNWVKQHLMLLAQNHPTSLLTLSKAWYVKSVDDNGNEEWIPATPQITSQMDSNQVKDAIDAFEKKMEQMAHTGDATQKRDGQNIAYPQTHSEEREHEVRVMKDGEEYVIYVNGDPQLAQAMNNTRAHRVREIQSGKLDRAAAWLGRKMAAAYTSLSPLFIPSNYFRDLTMTLASTAIREDAKYNYLLRKNLATSWNLGFMLRDYQNGKLKEKVSNGNATPKQQMFYDFMMNGGETGFVSSLDVEDLKKKFKNDLKDLDRWKTNPVKVGHTIMDGIEFLNRAIEDSNRFSVYMTSIQYGRSIDEAVNDAKDVTLNFNRKGTGEYGWQMIRNLYLFINPAVQSLQTLGALVKHHPFKFTAVTASWLASGVLVPIVNAALMSLLGGDDDKDKYWQFTKWDRRNNLIMWVPFTHEYVKIPLAQEFRAFYGVGDMIASKMMGGELAEESWSQYAEDLLGQVVDMLPLDPTGYDGNIAVSLMPNAIRPVFELAFNVDFTGKPLFKETEYNKYDPNFTKAYVGTPDWLVRVSKMVNSIGNDYPDVQQNSIDAFGDPRYNLNNPAVVDHVLSSYLGGAYTMGSQVLGVLTKSLNDPKEIKVADIPLFSKFVSNPDDRPVAKKQGDEFWNMKENHDRAANTLSKLKKQAKVDGDYSMLERFYGSEEYKQYKQDDVKVKKYEEDKKKERAEESGEEYRPHKLNAEDIYKAHATPKDDFEDLKLNQLYTKLNGFKTSYDLLFDTAPSQSDGYYNTNKAAIDAIDEISLDKQEISELKKGFLEDGKDSYNAEDMKLIRELRKKILSVLEKANKVVVANQKAKAKKK
jgi:site-specific DNA-cytosine methylase